MDRRDPDLFRGRVRVYARRLEPVRPRRPGLHCDVRGAVGGALRGLRLSPAPVCATFLAAALMLSGCFLFIRSAPRGLDRDHRPAARNVRVRSPRCVQRLRGLHSGGGGANGRRGVPRAPARGHDKAARGRPHPLPARRRILAVIALYGVAKPRAVFDNVHRERDAGARLLDDPRAVVATHPDLSRAPDLAGRWQFVPGLGTPLQYFLQNTLEVQRRPVWRSGLRSISPAACPASSSMAISANAWPCARSAIGGTLLALPMMLPLLVIHQKIGCAMAVAPLMGRASRPGRGRPSST